MIALTLLLVRAGPTFPVMGGSWDRTHVIPFESLRPLTRAESVATEELRRGEFGRAYASFTALLRLDPDNYVAEKGAVEAAEGSKRLAEHIGLLRDLTAKYYQSRVYSFGLGYGEAEWALAETNGPVAENELTFKPNREAQLALEQINSLPPARVTDLPVAVLKAAVNSYFDQEAARYMSRASVKPSPEMVAYRLRFLSDVPSRRVLPNGKLEPLQPLRQPDYPGTISACAELIKKYPTYSLPYYLAARTQCFLGHDSEALVLMKKFLALTPTDDGRYVVTAKKFVLNPTYGTLMGWPAKKG